ncbi:hypothetical protein ACBY01_09960 [Sphingomonas sp. ac-8]|uniref:hypothetical protein n=1 Tax=Sphingomonas sp. ac-8 TaxID=3242977 RepID=UPI003A80EF23
MTARIRPPLVEGALMLAVVASVAHATWFFSTKGYLPQPFVFDTNDTFMDWFNTAYWANRPGAYDVWRSIYPPLSFVFLDWTTLPGCYVGSPFQARDCDGLARATIVAAYVADVALLWMAFRGNDRRTAIPRTVAMALGLPLLFTLERGNLILAALPAFIVAHGPVTRSRAWRAIGTAITINFKPYLVLPALAHALRREWRPLELAGIATILLYLVTLAWVGAGSPLELASNTVNWVSFVAGQVWNEVNYSTSYAPLLLMRQSQLPLLDFVPSRTIEAIEAAVPVAIRSTQLLALATLAAAWVQPRALTHARLAAIVLGAYLVTQSPGGYTQVFLLFLVLLEPWKGGAVPAIVAAYLLCLVGDWPLATVLRLDTQSWLSGRPVLPEFGLTAGHFVRPALVILIVWSLALDALMRVARAHGDSRPVLGLAA